MFFYSKGRTNSLLNVTPVFVAKYIDIQFFSGSWRKCFFTQGKKLSQIFDYDTSKWNIVAGKNGVQGDASILRHLTILAYTYHIEWEDFRGQVSFKVAVLS